MLDALKFAFEILIVGALALPWLAVLNRMFPSSLQFDLSFVPAPARDSATIALVIALRYVLGSSVSRISRTFFDAELWRLVPTEHQIREAVYRDVYCTDHLLNELNYPLANPVPFATVPGLGRYSRYATARRANH